MCLTITNNQATRINASFTAAVLAAGRGARLEDECRAYYSVEHIIV